MPNSAGIPHHVIDCLDQTFNSIKDLCSHLTEQQWKMPTQLPGWTVQDNLSHILGTERLHVGLPETDHLAPDLSNAHNPIGEMNEHHVDLRRSRPGSEVFAEFVSVAEQRMNQLRSANAEYFAQPEDTPVGPGTTADFLNIRLLDVWVHEQDMRRTLNLPGHQGGGSAEHTIDRLCATLPVVIGKRAKTPEGATAVIEITGAVQRTIAITIINGRGQIVDKAPTESLVEIEMDSDIFLQLANGRAPYEELSTAIKISGDQELGHKIVTQFTMMI